MVKTVALAFLCCWLSCSGFQLQKLAAVRAPAGLVDLRGAVHVHSDRSKDAATPIDEIVAQASAVGLDFVVLTDHNHWRDSSVEGEVIVIGGAEYGPEGHLLGIGHADDFTSRQPRVQLADRIRQGGGLAVAAHPCDPYEPFPGDVLPLMDGMEIYSLSHDINEEGIPLYLLKVLIFPFHRFGVLKSVVDVPAEPLLVFDQVLAGKDFLGVGATDAHGTYGVEHAMAFTIVQTHVLARARSIAGVMEALRARRAYVSFEYLRPVEAFNFTIAGESTELMGATVSQAEGLELAITVAPAAEIRLLRDGMTAGRWLDVRDVREPVRAPGVYRVEARIDGRTWILSNAIRVSASVATGR